MAGQQGFQAGEFARAGQGQDAAVGGAAGQGIDLRPGQEFGLDPGGLGQLA